MPDLDDVYRDVSDWTRADTEHRDNTQERLTKLVHDLAVIWSTEPETVLYQLWQQGDVAVYPKVSKVARWLRNWVDEQPSGGGDDGVPF